MTAYLYIHYEQLDGATLSYLERTNVEGVVDMITLPGRRDTWVYIIDATWLEEWAANHGTSIEILGDEERSYQLQDLMMKELDTILATPQEKKLHLAKGSTISDLLKMLPKDTREQLFDLYGGSSPEILTLEGLGRVRVYLGDCSEGVDRGGHVSFLDLLDVTGPDGGPITLEADTDGSDWFFYGRYTKLLG